MWFIKNKKIMDYVINKLRFVARKSMKNRLFSQLLDISTICAYLEYKYNQEYTDLTLEKILLDFSNNYVRSLRNEYKYFEVNPNRVLIYDGFGLDLRGYIIPVVKAFLKTEYKIIYVTVIEAKGKQPHFMNKFKGKNNFEVYYVQKEGLSKIKDLVQILEKTNPANAFIYTYPWDVAAISVFNSYKNEICRYLLDLNDHAFWIGLNSFDFCIDSRDYGAVIARDYRDISEEKIVKLDVPLCIEYNVVFKGLPFDIDKIRFIFSGGALYKTLGDPENTYYKIVENILIKHKDINFVYAGGGDKSEFYKLMAKYPNRIYLFPEREDFYQIIERCVFYLNTYPMFGGMMMRYAANARKIPLTLMHDHDSEGLLLNQKEASIEYHNYEELIKDIDYLLSDKNYLLQRENLLLNSVMTEDRYCKNLYTLLNCKKTEFSIDYSPIDTINFRKEYINRLKFSDILTPFLKKKKIIYLIKYFPLLFIISIPIIIKRIILKIYHGTKFKEKWNL